MTRVVVDGRNVQGAMRRGAVADRLPEAAFVARLRAALAGVEVQLVLDGHPGGGPQGRIAPGFRVEYGRHRDADSVIGDLVADGAGTLGPAAIDAILVVTDDRAVQAQARRNGARVAGTAWLLDRVDRAVRAPSALSSLGGVPVRRPGTSLGHGRAPRAPRSTRAR
ncbi:MAG TPA: NYN domain-containing protein [Candidatus Deferrimicrobiaceae bacterium]|nr:NYN domain-containing protein [Candidatus Deferrimicrobiaceae bacterium]